MPWFRIDDQLHSHPKARRAGLEAMGMWSVAGSYAMGYKTDGFVHDWFVTGWKNGRKLATTLVAAGLWQTAIKDGEHGWQFHDWEDFQKSADDIEQDRELARIRQQRRREKQRDEATRSADVTRDTQRDSPSTSAERPGSTPSLPIHPSDVTQETPIQADPFDAFWKAYPRREDRGHAVKAFRAAARKANSETLIAAAGSFSRQVRQQRTEKKFIALASTWLNGERWLDYQATEPGGLTDEECDEIIGQLYFTPPPPPDDMDPGDVTAWRKAQLHAERDRRRAEVRRRHEGRAS